MQPIIYLYKIINNMVFINPDVLFTSKSTRSQMENNQQIIEIQAKTTTSSLFYPEQLEFETSQAKPKKPSQPQITWSLDLKFKPLYQSLFVRLPWGPGMRSIQEDNHQVPSKYRVLTYFLQVYNWPVVNKFGSEILSEIFPLCIFLFFYCQLLAHYYPIIIDMIVCCK